MPSDQISISLSLSRVDAEDLHLEAPESGYELVSVGPGGRVWRRDFVEGTYVHGRTLLNAVLETRTMPVVVRVKGDTWVEVRERAQDMIDALSQFVYLATLTIDGVTDYLVCEPGDVAIAGSDSWDKHRIMDNQQEYVLTIPYDPVKVSLS